VRQQAAEIATDSVDGDVQPAADGIVRRVLPGLQAVAMTKVVGGLPVVEGLVAVLDGGEERGDDVGGQEDVEGRDGLDGEGVFDGPWRGSVWRHGVARWTHASLLPPAGSRRESRDCSLFSRMLGSRVHKFRLLLRLGWRCPRGSLGGCFRSHFCASLSLV
jgi:hypothetical protein